MPPSPPPAVTLPCVTVLVTVAVALTVTVAASVDDVVAPPSPPVLVPSPVSSPHAVMAATATTLMASAAGRASRAPEREFLSILHFYASRAARPRASLTVRARAPTIPAVVRLASLSLVLVAAALGCGGEEAGDASGGGGGGRLGSAATTGEPEVCPWPGDDPGDLVATGNAVGSVIADVGNLVDQCGVERSIWDFAGGYLIVVLAEGW